jgi:protein involved in polysaccharide export with SLBB domain
MKSALRSLWLLPVLLAAGLACVPTTASAQGVAPTPEQAELLQSLPPEEQQILLEKAREGMTGTAPLVGVGDKVTQPQERRGRRGAEGETGEEGSREREAPPARPRSPAELKPFGYETFRRLDSDFEPEAAIPVPSDYVLGPGDRLEVQLYGNERGNYILIVGRDGQVRFPKLGPVSVGGMRFEEVRALITEYVDQQFVGTKVSVSMGELRSIRVFVLGDVEQPGSYLVSALSTISNALMAAGGISMVGSLRDVQLKRSGRVVTRLDLYDLLLKGDTSRDLRLLAGDVVFVPPVGATASVFGEVNRPGIYELRPNTTVGDLLVLSGGLRSRADPTFARLERVGYRLDPVTLNIDLQNPRDVQRRVENGDLLTVVAIRPTLQGSVELTGAVHRPRAFEWSQGLYLTDVIGSLDELESGSDAGYVLVRREQQPGQVEYFSADLGAALASKRGPADLALRPRDRLIVLPQAGAVYSPDAASGTVRAGERQKALRAMVEELRSLATTDEPSRVVAIGGVVRTPGEYPLERDMRISDLLRAGGQPADAAYLQGAELARYTVVNGETRQTEVISVDLAAVRRGDPDTDLLLRPYDVLTVKQVAEWTETEFVTLSGQVRFPGQYPIRRGESLRSVIDRAGGVLPDGFLEGAVFTREAVREREREQLDRLAARLQKDLSFLALQASQTATDKSANSEQALLIGRGLLEDLRSTQPVGRVVVDLDGVLSGRVDDVDLRDGDALIVPRRPQSVIVLGEVQSTTSHIWRSELTRDDYIGLSGGTTARADERRIYVVRADGSVIANREGFFSRAQEQIRPGDAIVVPIDAERMRPLSLWTAVTSIIFNLAVAVAAIGSL